MLRMQLPDVGGPLRWVTGLVASVLRPPGEPAAVMVVADHAVFAEALALAIDSAGSMSCVAVAESAEQALRLAVSLSPDVAVVDLDPEERRTSPPSGRSSRCDPRCASSSSPSRARAPASSGLRWTPVRAAVFPKTTSLGVVVAAIPYLSESPLHHRPQDDHRALRDG